VNRREVIKISGIAFGASLLGNSIILLNGCKNHSEAFNSFYSLDDVALFNEICDIIIPETGTPGAKQANTGSYIATMLADCYTTEERESIKHGVAALNKTCKLKYGEKFMFCSLAQKTEAITGLDAAARLHTRNKKNDDPKHFFKLLKELTVAGYFSSKQGSTMALNYQPVPGKYKACVPYKKGDKAWSVF
jgi:hypothetical protein